MKELYELKEVVYAFHGPLLYKAKIVGIQEDSDAPYLVHYFNWNKQFDAKLGPAHIRKYNAANKKIAQDLIDKFKEIKPPKVGLKKKKNAKSLDVESKESKTTFTTFFGIPDQLRELLVLDMDNIQADHKLVIYEDNMSLIDMVNAYKATIVDEHLYISEFLDGLVSYFDSALPKQLLYLFERPQLHIFIKKNPGFRPSKFYGLQHFLRLVTILPSLIPFSKLSEGLLEEFKQFVEDFLEWVDKHPEYIGKYVESSKEYVQIINKQGILV